MATISDLPNEILTLIFLTLYCDSIRVIFRANTSWGSHPPVHKITWRKQDLHAPNLFPCTVASVCCLWRDILALYPKFWTRLIFDNKQDIPLPVEAFNWSQDLNIDLLVIDPSDDSKPFKHTEASAIIKALYEHTHRCLSIMFEVGDASSLPSIARILDRANPLLHTVILQCRYIDENQPPQTPEFLRRTTFHKLSYLSLPGRTFMEIGRMQLGWLKEFTPSRLFQLSITQFQFQHPNAEGDPFTVTEFAGYIASLKDLWLLSLRQISLSYEPNASGNARLAKLDIKRFRLEDISASFLDEFMPHINSCEELTLTRCEFPKMQRPIEGSHLSLHTIRDCDSLENIINAWDGYTISLTSCPAFDDRLLNRLSPEEDHLIIPKLLEIELRDCSDFTPSALLNFLERRFQAFSNHKTLWDKLRRITAFGYTPSPTDEDISRSMVFDKQHFAWTMYNPNGSLTKVFPKTFR